jgi:hypothetical protein
MSLNWQSGRVVGSSWPLSYGSWIYNYPSNPWFILFNSYADCTTSGTGSTDPSGTSEFTTGFCFCSVRVAQSLFVGVVI